MSPRFLELFLAKVGLTDRRFCDLVATVTPGIRQPEVTKAWCRRLTYHEKGLHVYATLYEIAPLTRTATLKSFFLLASNGPVSFLVM
jgi:hypothetical protein